MERTTLHTGILQALKTRCPRPLVALVEKDLREYERGGGLRLQRGAAVIASRWSVERVKCRSISIDS